MAAVKANVIDREPEARAKGHDARTPGRVRFPHVTPLRSRFGLIFRGAAR